MAGSGKNKEMLYDGEFQVRIIPRRNAWNDCKVNKQPGLQVKQARLWIFIILS